MISPEQTDALENFLFLLFALMSLPISWVLAQKRGRRPWVWLILAMFIAWLAVVLLLVLPSRAPKTTEGEAKVVGRTAEEDGEAEQADAQENLRRLMGRR